MDINVNYNEILLSEMEEFDETICTKIGKIGNMNIMWNFKKNHTLSMRLRRVGITKARLLELMEFVIPKIKEEYGRGEFLVVFKKSNFQAVVKHSRRTDLFILTLLTMDMKYKKIDDVIIINENEATYSNLIRIEFDI